MSVIVDHFSFALQDLKTNTHQIKQIIKQTMMILNQDIIHHTQTIVQALMAEIKRKDAIIFTFNHKSQDQVTNALSCINKENQEAKSAIKSESAVVQSLRKELKEYKMKLENSQQKNEEYERQMQSILLEMREIKEYLKDFKSEKGTHQNKDESCEINYQIGQRKDLKNNGNGELDTIKEVTEMSLQSDNEEDQFECIQSDTFEQNLSPQTYHNDPQKHEIESDSFECMSEVRDLRLFFENSRETGQTNSLSQETYTQSLQVLKHFCSTENQNLETQTSQSFRLEGCSEIFQPALKLTKKINDNHLIYQNGYKYTGNTVCIGDQWRPMGFGQLFLNNNVFYCGNWKNGVFDGWGKIYMQKGGKVCQFNGQLSRGLPHGPGRIKYWNGDKFIGTFCKGRIQGEGKILRHEAQLKSGYWKDNILIEEFN